ncbi:alcohol dehydrogenase catalytic domain-containing protein [Rhizobium sp. TH2]|nr:alcohol dehydrogenase catalytic domain-containing protein [Rhizobium sp. TH2]UVC06929.1 alcohol dehydrogenase catalytic domain-containing protein [Rhizobium sp. TH2]
MRAARLYAAGDIRVEEVETPSTPLSGWVRLRVTAAGICGSDIHNFRTGQWISRSPSVPGHEFAGVVLECGEGVGAFAPGDTVVADSRFWCGECSACMAGRANVCNSLGFVGEVCDGGFAEFACLPERLLVKHEPSLDPAIAAMAEPLAVALHAVKRLAVPSGEAVLVAGCGPIGGLAALVLSKMGIDVLVADRNAARALLVAEVTGVQVVNIEDADVRYALDATGNIHVIKQLIDRLDGGGSLVIAGISHGEIALDPNILVERELSLIGCHAYCDELPEAVAMLPGFAPQLARFIDREITIDGIPHAYQRLLAGDAKGIENHHPDGLTHRAKRPIVLARNDGRMPWRERCGPFSRASGTKAM